MSNNQRRKDFQGALLNQQATPSLGRVAVGRRGSFNFFARPNPKKWLPSGLATNTERLFGDTPRLFHESCRCVAPKANPGPTVSCAAKTRLVAAATRIVLATSPTTRAARERSNLGDDLEHLRDETGHGKGGRTRRLKLASKPKTMASAHCGHGDLLVTPGTEHAHPAGGEAVPLALLTTCAPAVLSALVAFEVPPFADTVL